jgi:integrase
MIYTGPSGKRREMGLGGLIKFPLSKARELAASHRETLSNGLDPVDSKHDAKAADQAAKANETTFGSFADAWFASAVEPALSNPKSADQWRMTLTRYCEPIRSMPIGAIGTAEVLMVLNPLWHKIPETAQRLRGRIERVLDAATVAGVGGEVVNPARWRGHLDKLLPAPKKLTRGHHAAMPFADIPQFMANLRARDALAAYALRFVILTCARASEATGARWSKIDLDNALWTIPATRMKARNPHRVPLNTEALEILRYLLPMASGQLDGLLFPGSFGSPPRPLSLSAFDALRERMGVSGCTTHGFRSSFRDWAGEATSAPREVAEACLAHAVGNAVEAAYRRGDALQKRRELMGLWGEFCAGAQGSNIIALRTNNA